MRRSTSRSSVRRRASPKPSASSMPPLASPTTAHVGSRFHIRDYDQPRRGNRAGLFEIVHDVVVGDGEEIEAESVGGGERICRSGIAIAEEGVAMQIPTQPAGKGIGARCRGSVGGKGVRPRRMSSSCGRCRHNRQARCGTSRGGCTTPHAGSVPPCIRGLASCSVSTNDERTPPLHPRNPRLSVPPLSAAAISRRYRRCQYRVRYAGFRQRRHTCPLPQRAVSPVRRGKAEGGKTGHQAGKQRQRVRLSSSALALAMRMRPFDGPHHAPHTLDGTPTSGDLSPRSPLAVP